MQNLVALLAVLVCTGTDLLAQHTVFMGPFGESQANDAAYRDAVKRPKRQFGFEADHVAFYDGWKRAMSSEGMFEHLDAGPLGREVVVAEKSMTGADVIIGTLSRVGVNHMHVKAAQFNALHLVPQYPPTSAVKQPHTVYLYPSPAMEVEAQVLHATRTWRGHHFVLITDTIRMDKKWAERVRSVFDTIQAAGAAEPQILHQHTPADFPLPADGTVVYFVVPSKAETLKRIAQRLQGATHTAILVPMCRDCLPEVPGAAVLEPAWRYRERTGQMSREAESRAHALEAAWYMKAIGHGPYTPEVLATQRPASDACATGLPAWGYIRGRYKDDGSLGHWINAAVCLATTAAGSTTYEVVELPEW